MIDIDQILEDGKNDGNGQPLDASYCTNCAEQPSAVLERRFYVSTRRACLT